MLRSQKPEVADRHARKRRNVLKLPTVEWMPVAGEPSSLGLRPSPRIAA